MRCGGLACNAAGVRLALALTLHRTGRAGRARGLQVRGPFGLPCGAHNGREARKLAFGSNMRASFSARCCAPQPRTGAPSPTPHTPRSLVLGRLTRVSPRYDTVRVHERLRTDVGFRSIVEAANLGAQKCSREGSGGCVAGVRGRLCAAEERSDRRKKKRACLSRRRVLRASRLARAPQGSPKGLRT